MHSKCGLNRKAHDTCYFSKRSHFDFHFINTFFQKGLGCCKMRQAQRCDNHKWVGTTANVTENQFTDSRSTSTKQRGLFARGPSSLISSRKRLQVVKGGFSLQKRMLTGSSYLVGTLDRTMFAFDLCTATLMRWKS